DLIGPLTERRPKRREGVATGQGPELRSLVRRPGDEPSAVRRGGHRIDRAAVPGEISQPPPIIVEAPFEAEDDHPQLAPHGEGRAGVPRPRREEAVRPPTPVSHRVEPEAVAL